MIDVDELINSWENFRDKMISALTGKGERTMPDIGKVIKALELCAIGSGDSCYETECPYYRQGCTEDLKNNILALLKEQEPRLLELEEVKAIAIQEAKRIMSIEVEPVWLERHECCMTSLSLVLISWGYMEGIGEDETKCEFIVKYFGTDLDDTLNYLDYGTRWRVWSSKPTIEQRKEVKWDAAD